MKVWENSKKLWKHSPTARVSTAFLVLLNFPSCFYNSIEIGTVFFIQYTKEGLISISRIPCGRKDMMIMIMMITMIMCAISLHADQNT